MLPLIILIAIVAMIFLAVSTVILWLTGLLVATIFLILGIMILYALNKMSLVDIKQDRWLLVTPFLMFFLGLGLNKAKLLSIRQYSLTDWLHPQLILTLNFDVSFILALVIISLLIIDIAVSSRK